jgi:RND family efflux transporter MFP subunit
MERMRNVGKRRSSVALLAAGVALSAAACTGSDAPDPEAQQAVIPAVEAVQARSGRLPLAERLSGVVKSNNQVSITAEIEARVAEVLVRSGEAVRRGQPLVRLEDDPLREQLRQAEASVRLEQAAARGAQARADELQARVVRSRDLADQQLVSRLELETAEAQFEAAEADADQARARVDQVQATLDERRSAIEKTVVRSPVEGHVGRRNAEIGMLADTATILFEVGNLDDLMVEVPLTGEMLGFLEAGLPARVHPAAPGAGPIEAILSRISPFLAAGSFSTIGEIDVRNPDRRLRPGMFVTVDLLYGESESATLVPTSALWEDPRSGVGGIFVAALPPGEAGTGVGATLSEESYDVEFRPVEVVADGRETAGVRGVEAGEWVVTVGQHLLRSDDTPRARVRRAQWDHVLELQGLQREDLLRGFLEKQQRLARRFGARPPTTDEFGSSAPGEAPSEPPRVD